MGCVAVHRQERVGWGPPQYQAEHACREGIPSACGQLGQFLLARADSNRDMIDKNRERGLVLLEVACGQDDLAACTALGHYLLGQPEYGASLARARVAFAHACDGKLAEACTGLGETTLAEHAGDKRAAWKSLRAGCQLGDPRGCELFAVAQLSDRFAGDKAQALEALGIACAADRLSSCLLLARLEIRNPTSKESGLNLLTETCRRGESTSCAQAATFFAPLLSARPDCGQALPLAQKACAAKNDDACAMVEVCQPQVQGSEEVLLDQLEQRCRRNSALGCLYWADRQSTLNAAASDAGRVRGAYQVTCQSRVMGSGVACVRLIMMDLSAATSAKDAEVHLANLREACKESYGEACCRLAQEYQSGKWVSADAHESDALRTRACDQGMRACCSTHSP